MADGFLIRCTVFFEHFLDKKDPPAGTIVFIAQQLMGGTVWDAITALQASAKLYIGTGHGIPGQLLRSEIGLHQVFLFNRRRFPLELCTVLLEVEPVLLAQFGFHELRTEIRGMVQLLDPAVVYDSQVNTARIRPFYDPE